MPDAGSPAARRPAVVFLLPVWGAPYVTPFLDLSLRTLLAPGNIPAVAEACDCTFRILTTAGQKAQFDGHPVFQLLLRYCTVEFSGIDDLVHPGVHSLTITQAYVRGMRESGPAMTETYFVFLVADYIMADGSLRHLLRHIRAGVSGITAGNFQIVKEDAEPVIRAMAGEPAAPLIVSPRALLRVALDHLHPVVLASMPDAATHTMICNRLFWRAGEGTLVARFYLRHMLCIRPESDAFEIGSSCDYSFIPEMCPSGRVVAIADSDDYCVVEMQPRLHEQECIVPGRLTPGRLAGYLSDWTTAEHRRNAHTPVVFHTDDVSREVPAVVAESDTYVTRVEARLSAAPQPHRGHFYWHAAQAAVHAAIERKRRFGARASFTRFQPEDTGVSAPAALARTTRARRIYEALARRGFLQFPWHPSWLDSRCRWRAVLSAMRERAGLVVASAPTGGTDWAARRAGPGWEFVTPARLATDPLNGGPFTVCLLYLKSVELSSLPEMLRHIRPHLAAGARTFVVFEGTWDRDPGAAIAEHAAGFQIERVDVARSLADSSIGRAWNRQLRRAAMTCLPGRWAWTGARLALLALAALPLNAIRLIVPGSSPPTSVVVTLDAPAGHAPGGEHRSRARG